MADKSDTTKPRLFPAQDYTPVLKEMDQSQAARISADEANAIDALRYRTVEAIIAEINDPRNAVEPEAFRRGLIAARIIMEREAKAMQNV